jgi:hypothetical protein
MTSVERKVPAAIELDSVDLDVLMFLGPEVPPDLPVPPHLMSLPSVVAPGQASQW